MLNEEYPEKNERIVQFKEKLSKFSKKLLKSLEKQLRVSKNDKKKISNDNQSLEIFNGRPHSAPCFFTKSKENAYSSQKNREGNNDKNNNNIEFIVKNKINPEEGGTKSQGFYLTPSLYNPENAIKDKKSEGICLSKCFLMIL